MPHIDECDRRAMSQFPYRSPLVLRAWWVHPWPGRHTGGLEGKRVEKRWSKALAHLRAPLRCQQTSTGISPGLLRGCHLCAVTPRPYDVGSSQCALRWKVLREAGFGPPLLPRCALVTSAFFTPDLTWASHPECAPVTPQWYVTC